MKTLPTHFAELTPDEDDVDEIIAEVRRHRAKIWAEHGHDIHRYFAAMREKTDEAERNGRVVFRLPDEKA